MCIDTIYNRYIAKERSLSEVGEDNMEFKT